MTDTGTDDNGYDKLIVEVAGRRFPFSIRAMMERQIETLRVLYMNTQNPVYAWKAILNCTSVAIRDAIEKEAVEGWDAWTGEIPAWCQEYLFSCAYKISALEMGSSYDDTKPSRDISPPGAADMLPSAFGFTRNGWNAFADYQTRIQDLEMERFYRQLREDGASAQESMNKTLERYRYENERSVRRRIAELAKAYTRQPANGRAGNEPFPAET
jgi:hypothetical protein